MWLLRMSCLACIVTTCLTQSLQDVPVYIPEGSPVLSIPCMSLKSDQAVGILYWYKGESLDEALDTVLKQYDSSGDVNLTASEKYQLTPSFNLLILEVEATDTGRYWCRVVELNTREQHEGSVLVTVVSSVSLAKPVIIPCSKSEDDVCNFVESRRLIVDCVVTHASPRPTLTWSFVGCSGGNNQSQQWFLSNQQLSYNEDTLSYNVSQGIYLGRLELEKDDTCSFECETTGVVLNNGSSTIANESASLTIVVTGKDKTNSDNDPDDTNGGDGVTPSKGPNLGLTAVIIVLAFISLVCLIGIMYLISRVWCLARGTTKVDEEIELRKHEDSQDEKMCLLNAEKDEGRIQDIRGEIIRWQYKGKLSMKQNGSGDILHGVTGVLPSAGGGLVVATQGGLRCFSPNFTSISIKEDSDLYQDNIISMASHPNTDSLIVGLETGGLVFINVLTGRTRSIFPNEVDPDSQFNTSEIAVDNLGVIFAGQRNDRNIFMMETCTTYIKKFRVEINISTLTAYGSKHLFVSNGKDTIQKYHFKRSKSGYDMLNSKNKIIVNPIGSFVIKQITVHAGFLYAVNGYDTGCRILQYDVETFDLLQTLCTNLFDMQGLCFFGKFKVAVYEKNSVKIYEKSESDKLDSYIFV